MATRSAAIVIADGKVSEYFYRHWDGYPKAAGADLLRTAETLKWNAEPIIKVLEGKQGEVEDCLKKDDAEFVAIGLPRADYEPAGSLLLTDLDYFYVIDCDEKHVRCYENMFGHNPRNYPDLPPYKILKWL